MEIIARICTDSEVKRTLKQHKLCRDILKQFHEYLVEKNKYGWELNIPLSVPGCRELVNEVLAIAEDAGEDVSFIYTIIPLKKFTAKDYKNAVAYQIMWGNFVYGYEGSQIGVFWEPCCDNDRWYDGGHCGVQIGSYRMSKSQMGHKKCAITDGYDYVVNETIKNLMKTHGALEEDFFPVLDKDDEVTCWQLRPQNVLYGLGETNHWKKIRGCLNCGKAAYITNRYDYYWMNQDTIAQLQAFNRSKEEFGRSFQPDIIINKEIYEILKKACPRLTYEPIFLKQEED